MKLLKKKLTADQTTFKMPKGSQVFGINNNQLWYSDTGEELEQRTFQVVSDTTAKNVKFVGFMGGKSVFEILK